MKEPVDHVLRPRLPWRSASEPSVTECGYDASKVKTITREQLQQRLKEYGRQRTALVTCMTCQDAATRWATWEEDPRKTVEREITWECGWRAKHGDRLKTELLALAALAAAHPDEFREQIANIDSRRQWLEMKAKNERAQ